MISMDSIRSDNTSTAKTVSKNILFLLLGYVISQMVRIVYVGLLARYIGAEGFGQISTAIAVVSLAILIVNFGLDTLVIRDIASDRTRVATYVANVAVTRLVLSFVLAVILFAFVHLSKLPYETIIIIAIYALVYIFDAFSEVAFSIFHAFQKMEYRTAIDLARDFINVPISILGIYLGWSIVALVSVSAFASIIKLIISLVVMRWRFVQPRFQIDFALCRRILISALPFFLLICIGVASERLSIVILSWVDTAKSVGIYSAAITPISALLLVPSVFYHSIFPVFSQHYQKSSETLAWLYRTSYKVMMIVGFPMAAGTMLVSKEVISLIFGPEFEGAILATNILAIQLFTMVGYVNGAFLNATNRQNLFAILRTASVALNAILCFVLIPKYRYIGAAMSITIPAVIDFVLYSVLCHRYVGLNLPWVTALKISLSTAIMAAIVFLILNQGINVLLVILLGSLLYLVSLIVFKAISAEEWQVIRELIYIKRLQRTLAGN